VKLRLFLALVGTSFLGSLSLHAQFTWTGAGPDDNSTTASNWLGGVAPVGDGTEDFIFGDSPRSQPNLPTDFAVHNVTITARGTGYFWGDPGGGPTTNLTLTGDVTSTSGSGPFFVFNQDTLTLSPGTHTFTAGSSETGADLYVFGSLAGGGDLVKTGPRGLIVSSPDDASTYTGNIDLQDGNLNVAGDKSLGTGTITMDGGHLNVAYYDTDHTVKLYNNLVFTYATAYFGGDFNNPALLTFTGSGTAAAGVTGVYFYANNQTQLTLEGGLGQTDAGTSYEFDGGGTYILTGANTYTGSTAVDSGSTLIFGSTAPSMPGGLLVNGTGYLGSEVTTNVQNNFLNRFDMADSDGIIGLDSPSISSPQTFAEDLDLTGFNYAARFGTATAAIFSGMLTPQFTTYQFGGRGILRVTSDLSDGTGYYNLTASDGLQLYLSGHNTYTSGTTAQGGAAIVFDSNTAIPGLGLLTSNYNGYIGMTVNSSLTPQEFLGYFDTEGTSGVIGFDVSDPFTQPYTSQVFSGDIDLTGFNSNVFLGTSTAATLSGIITPYGTEYRFTGFRNGQLTVASTLSDIDLMTPRDVMIGLNTEDLVNLAPPGVTYHPSVTLTGDNTYTGGTYLQSGQLIVGQSNGVVGTDATTALGTGEVYIQYFGSTSTGLSVTTDGIIINNAFDFSSNDGFTIGGAFNFTLSGNLKGCAPGGFIQKIDGNTITLTGDNSNLDTGFAVNNGMLIFGSDTAAGTETLNLLNGNLGTTEVEFTSSAPVMGSLEGQGNTTVALDMPALSVLTINQTIDGTYDGLISGIGGINKDGPNALTLTNSNTYSGGTMITNGTLVATNNSALGTGAVVLNGGSLSLGSGVTLDNALSFGASGGTLGGNGTFTGPVTIGTNAHLAPGNSPGLMTFTGGLTWAPGGTYDIQVESAAGSAGVGYDSINVTGGLVFTATLGTPFKLTLNSLDMTGAAGAVTDFDNSQGYAWLIAHSDNLTGFDPNNVTIDTTNFTNSLGTGGFNVSAIGNDIFLNFSPVPEPSTYALLGLGLGTLWLGCRRRRRA
jgi:autotransporter-associated beta strand protein